MAALEPKHAKSLGKYFSSRSDHHLEDDPVACNPYMIEK